MKILHVCKKYPSAMGGDAVVVANLQKQQLAANHQVAIATSNCDEIKNGVGIYKLGLKVTAAGLDTISIKRLASLVVLFFRMFGILHKERPHVIHTHSVDMAFFTSFAARLFKIPLVHTFHIVTFYDTTQAALRRKSELWLLKKANPRAVTAPNRYDVEKLKAAGVDQAVLLPNGVDLTFWKPSAQASTSKEFVFLAVGRMEHQKGYEYLIRAASLLAKASPNAFKVVIVGEGSQKKSLRELARTLKVEKIVEIVGAKTPKETHALLSQANAAICPSLYETTPLTLLEAWSAAVPIISTPVGILRDAPADFGAAFMVPLKDPGSLMLAMKQCMADPLTRAAIAIKGNAEAKKYAWPAVTQTAEAIYRGVQ